jgi:hypothetical protein
MTQEQERRRIGQELHDEIGQRLTGILLQLKQIAADAPTDMQRRLYEVQESARACTAPRSDANASCAPPCRCSATPVRRGETGCHHTGLSSVREKRDAHALLLRVADGDVFWSPPSRRWRQPGRNFVSADGEPLSPRTSNLLQHAIWHGWVDQVGTAHPGLTRLLITERGRTVLGAFAGGTGSDTE